MRINRILSLIIITALIMPGFLFAQNDSRKKEDTKTQESKKTPPPLTFDKSKFFTEVSSTVEKETPALDYKIISSNNSYMEIEFTPYFYPRGTVKYNNKEYSILDFQLSNAKSLTEAGSPDVRSRSFGVMFPSLNNNTITIVDYDASEIKGLTVAPIPKARLRDFTSRSLENADLLYEPNTAFYSRNSFYPENVALISGLDEVRDVIIGNLIINPIQYNPVTGVVKQYTRIRVRINFGQQPVFVNRSRNREEISLLKDAAINSSAGLSWMNPRLSGIRETAVVNSVLSTGEWYKIEIKDNTDIHNPNGLSEGIYKISKSFLTNSGINLNGVDPRNIRMFSNGGYVLQRSLGETRPVDIQEIRVFFQGEGDGSFDNDDYILFYARSIHNWNYDAGTQQYWHYVNEYTNSNYYWIQIRQEGSPVNGLRMQTVISPNSPNPSVPTSFTEKIFREIEQDNPLNEGSLWLGDKKSKGQTIEWNTTLAGVEANSQILYKVKPACRVLSPIAGVCPYDLYFEIKENNSNMSPVIRNLNCVYFDFGNWISTELAAFTINSSQLTNGEQSSIQSRFTTNAPDGDGYMDWIEVQYKRRLNSFSGDFARFNSIVSNGFVEYNVSSFSNNDIRVFDVTSHNSVSIIQPISASSSNVKFQKEQTDGELYKFFTIGSGGYKTPASISGRIDNQNYRGGFSDGASFIIITHKDFLSAANRLKTKREAGGPSNPNYMKTLVFETDKIMNEFGGGNLDAVAIRDFLKSCYDNWLERPSHVFFLGDGSLDYKNLYNQNQTINWVPVYEVTDPQIHQVQGYVTDDYYCDLVSGDTERPDLSSGRYSCRSLESANDYLDKIDCYEDPTYNAYWKNTAVFVADDGVTTNGIPEGDLHTAQAEQLAEEYVPAYIEKKKIYIVTYPTVITSQGRRKPTANREIAKSWNEGTLAIHYVGHGSPDVWAHEYILEKDVIMSQLNNNCRYPIVTIASCDFSKYDNPLTQSGGELFTLGKNKGAIGSLAASRPVYSQQNAILSNAFYGGLLFPRDTLLFTTRIGKGLFTAKRQVNYTENEKKYILMGDPTVRIGQPRYHSVIDSISGLLNDTMRALSRIKIYGSIIRPDSTFWDNFNGLVNIKVFDVTKQITLLDEYGYTFSFKLNGGIIFAGRQNVNNGKWSVEYIVPKDISYLNQSGKIINYFYNSTDGDGVGLNTDFIVGGIDPNAPIDTTGPQISMFINNRNFRTGDVVNPDFKFIADLFDESGINTTGTIGHKIEATLDNNINQKYDLTNFYNSDTSYKSGSLSFDFAEISIGKHTMKLTAWDTYNNSSEATIEFDVSEGGTLKIMNVYNFPNPFKENTAFTFQHNFANPVNVKIKIYTVAGRLIKEISQNNISDKFVNINWTGKDEDGETLGNGIYIYKLMVDDGSGQTASAISKMAVLK